MGRTHVTTEGFTLKVFSTMYVDWGLSIERDERDLFWNPHCLSNESYGRKPNPDKYEDWEEAEKAALDGDDKAFIPWTDADWQECLANEADTLIEAYLGHDIWDTVVQNDAQHKAAQEWAFEQIRVFAKTGKWCGLNLEPFSDKVETVLDVIALTAAVMSPYMEDENDILDDLHEAYEEAKPKPTHNDPHKLEWLSGLVFVVEDDEVGQRRRVKVALGDDVALSIVAGDGFYSEPRQWAAWSKYTEVEVAVLHAGSLTHPRSVGVTDETILDLFEPGDNPVAPYVPVGIVSKMAAAITNAQKEG